MYKRYEKEFYFLLEGVKKLRVKHAVPTKLNNKKQVNVLVKGLLPYPIATKRDSDFIEYPKNLSKKICLKTGLETISFDWFATSEENRSIMNICFKEYVEELRVVIKSFIKTKPNYKINFITNSFGSAPLLPLIREYRENVNKVIMMGPVTKDSLNSIKFRFSKKNMWFDLFRKFEKNFQEKKEFILNDYSKLDSMNLKIDEKIEVLILIGENESHNRIKYANEILEINRKNVYLKIFKNASHLVYRTSANKKDNIKLTNKTISCITKFIS